MMVDYIVLDLSLENELEHGYEDTYNSICNRTSRRHISTYELKQEIVDEKELKSEIVYEVNPRIAELEQAGFVIDIQTQPQWSLRTAETQMIQKQSTRCRRLLSEIDALAWARDHDASIKRGFEYGIEDDWVLVLNDYDD